jgi:hypothetical protein
VLLELELRVELELELELELRVELELEPELPVLLPEDELLRGTELLVPALEDEVDDDRDDEVDVEVDGVEEEDLLEVFAVLADPRVCDVSSIP